MNQKTLLLAPLLLLGAAAAVLWWYGVDDAPPVHAAERTSSNGTIADPTAAAGVAPDEATGGQAVEVAHRADAATGSQRPFRDDAEWIVVRVVDKASGQPAPAAMVYWCDERGHQLFNEDLSRTSLERSLGTRWTERAAELFGWWTTADRDGVAKITRKGWTSIAAAHEGKYGTLSMTEQALKPANGFVIELVPDHTLRVRVVDEHGAPAAGIPISLAKTNEAGEITFVWNWSSSAITGDDGIAPLLHMQTVVDALSGMSPWEQHVPAGPWKVFALVPGHDDPGAIVSIDPPPDEVVELRLPACGRVRARVEIGGEPTRSIEEIMLVAHSTPSERGDSDWSETLAIPDADGWARFAHVPLNLRFSAQSGAAGGVSADFDGPRTRDQEVAVVLGPAPAAITLRGRLVVAPGEPLCEQKFAMHVIGPGRQQYFSLRTDAGGKFTVTVGEKADEGGNDQVDNFWFDVTDENAPPLRATAAGRTLRAGIEDLGDLLLKAEKPFCSGRFVCGDQPYTKRVDFWVTRWTTQENGQVGWNHVPGLLFHRDDAGNFSMRGPAPPGRYRMNLDQNATLPCEPVDFEPGATNLVVAVDPGHPLAATVLVPEGAPWGALAARLVPAAPAAASPKGENGDRSWLQAAPDGNWTSPRWHLQWPAMPAGNYALEVMVASSAAPMVRIDDVRVPAPAGGDPRLEDIDLRTVLRVVQARLMDSSGQLLPQANGFATAAVAERERERERWSVTFYDAQFTLLVPRAATDLLFVESDHRPTRVQCDADQLEVRLDAWPTIELTIANMPKLPDGLTLLASLSPIDPVKAVCRSQWNEMTEFFPFAPSYSSCHSDGDTVVLPIGEGKYELSLYLCSNVSAPLPGATPHEFTATTRSAVVTVPSAAWTKALQETTPQEKASSGDGRR